MFADDPIYPSLPATDLERAKRFYAEKLGLTPESELPGGLWYRCGRGPDIFSPHHPRYVENQREQGRNGKPTSPCSAGVQGTPAGEFSVR
jgi:catechol 2,3-dioxygenase-like lactoylglutathione lyase family enzyme